MRGNWRSWTASAANLSASEMSSASRSGCSERTSSLVMPSATIARTVATGNRRPRIHGTPAILDGSEVILAKAIWPGYPDAVAWIPTSQADMAEHSPPFRRSSLDVSIGAPIRTLAMDQRDRARHGSRMDETLIGYARCSTDEQDLTAQRQARASRPRSSTGSSTHRRHPCQAWSVTLARRSDLRPRRTNP